MIIDSIGSIMFYEDLLPNLKKGMEAIESAANQQCGKYPFEGGYYLVQEGDTHSFENGSYELHRRYIDVQILLEGEEEIAWHDLKDLEVMEEYDEASDKERLKGCTDVRTCIRKGMFWAAFPQDAHMAICHSDTVHHYRKIVLKLPYSKEEK